MRVQSRLCEFSHDYASSVTTMRAGTSFARKAAVYISRQDQRVLRVEMMSSDNLPSYPDPDEVALLTKFWADLR